MSYETLPEPLAEIHPNGVTYTVEEYDGETDTYRCQAKTARGDTQLTEVPGDVVRALTDQEAT